MMLHWLRRSRKANSQAASTVAEPVSSIDAALTDRLRESTAVLLERLHEGFYDFVDLGTCDGGGFEIAARQGGRRGLGFDVEPSVVSRSLDKGLDVVLRDVCSLQTSKPLVDFAVCSHILEHLPSLDHIERVLSTLSRMCRDYILISGPCFEEENYLRGLDLKLLHSLQLDHTCKMKVIDLIKVLHDLRLRDYAVGLTERIHESSNHWIHSAHQDVSPEGLWTYDKEVHLTKPQTSFDREIYRDFVCVVMLRSGIDANEILDRFLWGYDKVVCRSSWRFSSEETHRTDGPALV